MIQVENLTKKYGDKTAVSQLSFTVERGQVYGFLGPNGAGKTTTMNVMTGYLAATEGTVVIDGHDIFEQPELAKQLIGYMPEQPPLYPDMTVTEQLRFCAGLKRLSADETKKSIEHVCKAAGIADVANRLIRFLSKGYRQRVGLACALIGDPEVLILDEPTVGLDPKQVVEIRELIRALGKKHTVIFSSHILSEVSSLCDTVLIINNGKLIACDTPANLSRGLAGGSVLRAVVEGSVTRVKKAVSALGGVKKAQCSANSDGTVSVTITPRGDNDIRREVSRAVVSAGCILLSLEAQTLSLEEVFLRMTASEGDGEETV